MRAGRLSHEGDQCVGSGASAEDEGVRPGAGCKIRPCHDAVVTPVDGATSGVAFQIHESPVPQPRPGVFVCSLQRVRSIADENTWIGDCEGS